MSKINSCISSHIKKALFLFFVLLINTKTHSQIPFLKYHAFGTNYNTWTFHASAVIGNDSYYSLDFVYPNGSGVPLYTIVKINNDGEVVWSKRYTSTLGAGGGYYDIKPTSDSNLVFLLNNNSTSIALVKIDTAGNVMWNNSFSAGMLYGQTVLTTDASGIYVATRFLNNLTGFFKVSNSGNLVAGSFHTVALPGGQMSELVELNLDNYGNRYLTGLLISSTVDSLAMMKVTPSNNVAWVKKYVYGSSSSAISNSISFLYASKHWHNKNGNSFYLGGSVVNTAPAVENALFKVDTSGTPVWTYHSSDNMGHYYFNGEDNAGVHTITSEGFFAYGYILSFIDQNGNLQWSRRSALTNIGSGVNKLGSGDLMVYGDYYVFPDNTLSFMMSKHLSTGAGCVDSAYAPVHGTETVTAIPLPFSQPTAPAFTSATFIVNAANVPLPSVAVCDLTSTENVTAEQAIHFSTVSDGYSITAFTTSVSKTMDFSVFDFSGQKVTENKIVASANESFEIKLPGLPNGIYFIRSHSKDFVITQKFLVIR